MIVANNASGDSTVTKELKRLAAALTEIKDVFHIDARTIPVEVPSMVLGEINGTEEGFFRLQSAFRTIERENEMLREKYLNLEKEVPNSHALTDKERVIENLTKQIVDLTEEISRLKSQASVNINVNTNSEEF
jgi:predicted RNase H-like nuclease (RuvC/YqgF family)